MNAPQPAAQLEHQHQGVTELDRLLAQPYSPRNMMEGDSLDKMLTLAQQLASSKLSVPDHLRNNVGDCLAIVTQAMLWNMNPFAVAQKTHLVNGKLGYEAQLINAVVQNSGAVRGSPRYEYSGDGQALECRAGYVERGQQDITWTEWLRIDQITTKNSPLWKTNPKQQMGYLQIKNWARAFCPGAILGVYTVDELEDNGEPWQQQAAPERTNAPQRKSAAAAPAPAADSADPETGETPAPPPAAPARQAGGGAGGQAGSITGGQVAYLRNKLRAAGVDEPTVCDRYQVTGIELLSVDQFDALKAELLAMS